ncbi:uncharacterized protein LOC144873102 isoform X2 [Branchiostoma floridae x Branchiostoma japonicum]
MILRILLAVLLGAVWTIDAAQVCRTAHGRPFSCPRSRVYSFNPDDIYCCGRKCCSDPCRSTVSKPDHCMTAGAWKVGSIFNMSTGAIVGIIVAAITLTVIIVGAIVCCYGKARKNNKKEQTNAVQMTPTTQPTPSPPQAAQYPERQPAYPQSRDPQQNAQYPAQQPAYPQYPQDVYVAFGHTSKI